MLLIPWRHLTRRVVLASTLLLLAGIGSNIIALALFLVVRPFSRALYRRLAAQYVACMLLDAMSILLPGANIQITGDSDMPDGITAGIVVANHQYEGDWWFMLMAARFLGVHGNVKIVVKEELKRLPLLGWILRLLEYPVVCSSWSRCRGDLFALLRSFTADSFPVLLFQFPEGDRIDANIRQQSIAFAEKEKRPQLLHVLLPRTTGFNACIEALRNSHPVVYDMTIAFPGYTGQLASNSVDTTMETFWRFCNGEGPREVHIRVKRYQLEEVLADPHWLDNRWAEKDRMLTYFGRTEQLPSQVNGRSRGAGGPGANYVRTFNSRSYKAEIGALALMRLCLTPLMLPCLLLMAWPAVMLYVCVTTLRRWVLPEYGPSIPRVSSRELNPSSETPMAIPTPFMPQTPFTSPLIGAFDMVGAPRRPSPQPKPAVGGDAAMAGLQPAAHKRIVPRSSFEMPAEERPPRAPLHKTLSNQQLNNSPPMGADGPHAQRSRSSNSIISSAAASDPPSADSRWSAAFGLAGGGQAAMRVEVGSDSSGSLASSNGGYQYGIGLDAELSPSSSTDDVALAALPLPAGTSPTSPSELAGEGLLGDEGRLSLDGQPLGGPGAHHMRVLSPVDKKNQ